MTLHSYEPDLRELIVEGESDAGFFAWFLREHDIQCDVFAVDARVEVDSSAVLELNLEVGARGRAVALAAAVHNAMGPDQRGITVVVDADFSRVLGPMITANSCLLLTDYPALEIYAIAARPFGKFLRVVLKRDDDPIAVLDRILPVLTDLFACRAVLHMYGIAMVSGFLTLCDLERSEPCVSDINELLRRSTAGVADVPAIDVLAQMVEQVRTAAMATSQLARGHDVIEVVRHYFSLRARSHDVDALEASLKASVEVVDLEAESLFRKLLDRLAS